MRKDAQLFGFRYTAASAEHIALPFLQLESILKTQNIPYVDNVTALENLVSQFPNLSWLDLAPHLKKNYIFHESCHAVARSYFRQDKNSKNNDPNETAEGQILQILLEESFANTCELMAMLDVRSLEHEIFYAQNSYTWLPEVRSNMRKINEQIGEEALMQLIVIFYLYSNFLKDSISEKDLSELISLLELKKFESQSMKTLRSLIRVAFTLDYEFRTVTTGLHLKLLGLNVDLQKFDILRELRNNKKNIEMINSLCRSTLRQ